jgi:crotonobetainyl-CoA:carnitine CoA-transferase CaiB-like acyl-CoA transferase
VPIVDLMTGMYAAVAVLAAVARRDQTGRGDYIDLAMLDVQAAFLANQAMNFLVSGKPPRRNGNSHPNIQPQNVYRCRDGYLALAVGNDGQFAKFAAEIGQADLAQDPRFTRNADRVRNLGALNEIITEALTSLDRADLASRLDAAGVPCSPINTVPDLFEDPQIKAREMLRTLPHPAAGQVSQVVSPLRFTEAPLQFDRAPPLLGQHTDEVLGQLGLDEAAIAQLRQSGVL